MLKNQYRFFVPFEKFQGRRILITDQDLVYQISRVLRLKIGDEIILLDNSGFEYLASLEKIGLEIEAFILEKRKNENEPEKKIILCQSLLKGNKFEQVLRFCTNIGVVKFIPFVSKYSVVKEISPHKLNRYFKIIKESAEQSGRGILPELKPVMDFGKLIDFLKKEKKLKLIGWEKEKKNKIIDFQEKIKKAKEIYLLIGPEGGFEKEEIELAKKAGCLTFSLGKLILLSEIAGLVSAAFIFCNKNV